MPVVSGKPGTKRIRGILRQQCAQVERRMVSMLNYNAKVAAYKPPITFLSPLNLASVTACRDAMANLLAQVN